MGQKPLKIDETLKLLVEKDAFCVTESAKFSKKIDFLSRNQVKVVLFH